MKLLLIGPTPPPWTGMSISFKKLRDSFLGDFNLNGWTVKYLDTAPKKNQISGKFTLTRFLQINMILVKFVVRLLCFKPNVIYLTKGATILGFWRDFFLILLRNALSPKTKFVVHLKGGNYDNFYESCNFIQKKFIKQFIRNVDGIIVLGKSLVKMYDFEPSVKNKICVIENALAREPASKDAVSHKCTLPAHEPFQPVRVLFLSNLIYTKGYTHLLDACNLLFQKGIRNFQLIYAGAFMRSPDDPETDMGLLQKKFLERLNSASFAYYAGVVTGKNKDRLLSEADIFVLPTNYYVEGQPVSIIEAMAYGCAIVTTDYRSIPDLVKNRENAIFVKYSDPESIAGGLNQLILNPDLLKRAAVSSRAIYKNKFRWEIHYEKMKSYLLHGKCV